MRASIVYAVQRAVLFLAPFAILMIAQVPWYLSLIVALVFAFCASYIFLRRSRDAAVAEFARMRPRASTDDDEEDAAAGTEADEAPDHDESSDGSGSDVVHDDGSRADEPDSSDESDSSHESGVAVSGGASSDDAAPSVADDDATDTAGGPAR